MEIPKITIRRLCRIYRLLEQLADAGRKNIFSDEIGDLTGLPPYQIRKDISYLGEVGTPGRGYDVEKLKNHIGTSLNLCSKTKAVCVGVGRLGSALLNYVNLPRSRYEFVAAFDINPKKIGKKENGILIYPADEVTDFVRKNNISTGVITVPSQEAQKAADALIEGGVTGILNFAPVVINVPDTVVKRCIDFSIEMNFLTAIKSDGKGR